MACHTTIGSSLHGLVPFVHMQNGEQDGEIPKIRADKHHGPVLENDLAWDQRATPNENQV